MRRFLLGMCSQRYKSPYISSNRVDVSDGGLVEASGVLQLVNALQLLLSGGPDGSLDWGILNKNVRTASPLTCILYTNITNGLHA